VSAANRAAAPVFPPRQDQFQHDVVGKQDIRRMLEDPLVFLFAFLTGVPSESNKRLVALEPRVTKIYRVLHAGCLPTHSSDRRQLL